MSDFGYGIPAIGSSRPLEGNPTQSMALNGRSAQRFFGLDGVEKAQWSYEGSLYSLELHDESSVFAKRDI